MPQYAGIARRGLGAAVLCAGLALAGCRTITIAPTAAEWSVAGVEKDAQASWRAGDVEIVVPLVLGRGATSVAGTVLNSGAAPVQVTFSAPSAPRALMALGTASGGRWSESILAGLPIDVPAGTADAPGTVRFALSPDEQWSAQESPPVGSRIACDIAVTSDAGGASCPFRFRVAETTGWVSEKDTAVIVTLLALAGLVAWAGTGTWIW